MNTSAPAIDILLATCNGGRFLAEQLDSIAAQTVGGWRLLARDDGSTDDTRAILARFRDLHPAAVELVEEPGARLGPAGNFHRLLQRSTAAHVLFCDQDDVWQPSKIARLIALAREHERPGVPLLVHSDLEVVDRDLRPLAPSFWHYQYIDPARCRWSQLLVQNVVTGCACLFNAALRRAALPLPQEAIMHDWWLALVAATKGEIYWTREATVRYRQHGGNDTGAKRWNAAFILRRTADQRMTFPDRLLAYRRQAAALACHGGVGLSGKLREVIQEFSVIDVLPRHKRAQLLWRHRIWKTGWLRNGAFLAGLTLLPRFGRNELSCVTDSRL